jgi:3'-phosphoadenosine 5'-phosphosulfate (PAPS) 3'-phosphatase
LPEPDDLRLLEDAVRAGGDIARKFYGGDYKRWSKDGGSPVTEADLAVDKYLAGCRRKAPTIPHASSAARFSWSIPSMAPSPS